MYNLEIPSQVKFGLISLDFIGLRETIFSAHQFGFNFCELYIDENITENEFNEIVAFAKEKMVKIEVLSSLTKVAQVEDNLQSEINLITKCLIFAKKNGIKKVGFMFGGKSQHDLTEWAHISRFVERLNPLINLAKKYQITLLVENVFSRIPPGDLDSVEKIQKVFSKLDVETVKLNFDVGNLTIAGHESYPFGFSQVKSLIGSIHIKDVTLYKESIHGDVSRYRPLQDHIRGLHVSVPIGRGSINYLGLLQTLQQWESCPVVFLEPFVAHHLTNEWILETMRYLKKNELIA